MKQEKLHDNSPLIWAGREDLNQQPDMKSPDTSELKKWAR